MTTLLNQLKRQDVGAATRPASLHTQHDGTQRPLGIPALRDRIVQEVLWAILTWSTSRTSIRTLAASAKVVAQCTQSESSCPCSTAA